MGNTSGGSGTKTGSKEGAGIGEAFAGFFRQLTGHN
jgi:hypothetical protein